MKILILTQKVNKNDPILGFFHWWLEEFSKRFEKITVICLEKGEYSLPENVKVFSLGKESGKSKIKYVFNFYKYIWQERKNYDAVFVHMNQEYVILGCKLWKLWGKKIYFWRNHPRGNFFTRIAVWISNKVFYTSPQSFVARFKKSVQMPVGINTELFKPHDSKFMIHNSILSLGRISPIKNIDKLIEAVILLDKEGVDFKLDIVGDPVNKEDKGYQEKLFEMAKPLVDKGKIKFIPAVSQDEAVKMYQTHQIFVNLTPSGSFDKTILEAVACDCVPIVRNSYFKGVFERGIIKNEIVEEIAGVIKNCLLNPRNQEANSLRNYVEENHNLNILLFSLVKEINV